MLSVVLALSLFAADDLVTIEIPGTKLKKRCFQEDLEKCALVLQKDVPAPFEGVLQTPKLAADLTAKSESVKERIEEAVNYERRQHDLEMNEVTALHEVDVTTLKKENEALLKAVDDAKPSWYEKPFVVALATTIVVVAAISVSASLVRPSP